MINDHPPKVLFQIYDSQETKKGLQNWGQQREPKWHLKYNANWKHVQTGGLIKKGQKVADMADKGAGVGSEVRANEKDGWWMVLIQEAATLLYLGSTSPTCLGDGLAVSRLFMDHRASPISYMPPNDYNSKTVTSSPLIVCPSLSFCLIYFPTKKMYFFVFARWLQCNSRQEERGHFISTIWQFWKCIHYDDFNFQIYHPETCVHGEKEGGKQAEGKIEPNPTISSPVARF